MNTRIISAALLASSLLLAACSTNVASSVRVPQIAASVTAAGNVADPAPANPSALPPLPAGDTVKVNLVLLDRTLEIAPGIKYQTWTFNGTLPGPVIQIGRAHV